MILMPKKPKYRKIQNGRIKGMATRKKELSFGSYGLKSLEKGLITSSQIEAARRILTKFTHKGGKLWIRIFPDKPITKKGLEMPMGGGKGEVDHYAAVVKPGMILFELAGIEEKEAKEAVRLVSYKLPVKIKFVKK